MKRRKALVMAITVVLLLSALSVSAFAVSFGTWSINPGGLRISSSGRKTDTVNVAVVGATTQKCAAGSYRVRYRALAIDGSEATQERDYAVLMPSFSLPYLSGYGITNDSYKLRVKVDSSSAGAVTVAGRFTP